MTLNAVVLPAPFGPIRPTISPSLDLEIEIGDGNKPAEMHGDVLDRRERCPPAAVTASRTFGPARTTASLAARGRLQLAAPALDRGHDALAAGQTR